MYEYQKSTYNSTISIHCHMQIKKKKDKTNKQTKDLTENNHITIHHHSNNFHHSDTLKGKVIYTSRAGKFPIKTAANTVIFLFWAIKGKKRFPLCRKGTTGWAALTALLLMPCLILHNAQRLQWVCCPGHARVRLNELEKKLTQDASTPTGLQLGKAEALKGWRNTVNMDRPEHHRTDYPNEGGTGKGSEWFAVTIPFPRSGERYYNYHTLS